MKNNNFVSVIIPNYNHAKYLDQRIQSVLNQSYQNYEVIILDDCSTDNSKEIIEKYRSNPKISHIIYNEVNSGSTFIQWHKGFELAKGELIWIAESDDYCKSNLLERLVEEFNKDDELVLAFSHSMIIDENGNILKVIQNKKIRKNIHQNGILFIQKFLYWDNVIYNASSALFKKETAIKISPDYMTYKGSGDWLFWIKICEKGMISMVSDPLNYFRKHHSNQTEQYKSNGVQQLENKKIFDYLVSQGLLNRISQIKLLGHNFWAYNYEIVFASNDIKKKVLDEWDFSWCAKLYCIYIRILLFIFRIILKIKRKI